MKHSFALFTLLISLSFVICPVQAVAQNQICPSKSNSQLFEWSYMPVFFSWINTAQHDENGNWFVGGQLHDPLTYQFIPTVIKLSPEGEELWTYPQYGFEWGIGVVDKIRQSSDGSILAAGGCMLGCDYGPTGIFLHKVNNSTGQTIWRKIFSCDDWAGEVYEIMEVDNGDIILLSRERFYKASSSGDSLLTAEFDLNYSNHFTAGLAENDHLLLAHQSGIIKSDFDGNIISEHIFEGPVRTMISSNNEYLFVTDNKVIRTDLEINTLNSFDFSELVGDTFQVTVGNDKFIITGNNHILQIDFTPSLMADNDFETPGNFEIVDITEKNDLLFTAGKTSGAIGNISMTAKTYTLEGNAIEYFSDAGLSNLRVENIEAVESTYQQDLYDIYWDAWVTIHNFGSDTLNRCDFTSRMVAMSTCGHWVYLIPQEELNLLPGELAEVSLGQMKDFSFYLPGADSLTYTLKMFSMQPNNRIDRNPANDMAEITFTVDLTVDIKELNQKKLNIYPNPAGDYITINNPENEIMKWEISDLLNKRILQGLITRGNTKIDLSLLKPGIYLIRTFITSGPGHVEKLIVR